MEKRKINYNKDKTNFLPKLSKKEQELFNHDFKLKEANQEKVNFKKRTEKKNHLSDDQKSINMNTEQLLEDDAEEFISETTLEESSLPESGHTSIQGEKNSFPETD